MEELTRPISTQLEDILRHKQAVVFWPDALLQLFPACAVVPRDSLPRGRLKDSDNFLRDEFRIDVPGALMDNSGRRNDLTSLIMERIRVVAERVEATLSIPQAKAQSDNEGKRLEARLAELSRHAKPVAPPKMEATDTQVVLLQRLSASSVDTILGDRIFLAMEDGKAWPHLFPDDSMSRFANWTGATSRSWRSWVSARAKAWTEGSVIFQDNSPCIRPIGDAEYASDATSAVAALAAAPMNRLAWGPRLNLRGPNPDGTEWEEYIQGVFLFDAPLVAKSDACTLQVVGVRLVKQPPSKESQGGRYLIWSVKFPVSPPAAPPPVMHGLSNLDVLGIRLGMLEREADRIVRSRMKVGWIYVRARVDGMGDRPHQALKLYVSLNTLENIAVYSAPSPKGPAVVAVRRTEATEAPVPNESIEKLLIEKYGPQSAGVNGHWVWGRGECGSVDESSFELKDLQKTEGPLLDDGEFSRAVRAVDLMNHSLHFTPEMFKRYGYEKCSAYLHVFKKPKEIETTLLDHSRTPWNPAAKYSKPHF